MKLQAVRKLSRKLLCYEQKERKKGIRVLLLQTESAVLLVMPLWISNLLDVHERNHVGNDMQRDHLAVPGLWGY